MIPPETSGDTSAKGAIDCSSRKAIAAEIPSVNNGARRTILVAVRA